MIGDKIRELREADNILLRQLAAKLDIDTAMLSKMERGERSFKKDDILQLAEIFKQQPEQLLALWLADKVLKTIENEDHQEQALELAIQSLKH